MEVHHSHHHGHKKKWNELLLEFLMLFLAVSLGFIAENIREEQINHHKAKIAIKNIFSEIQGDIGQIDISIKDIEEQSSGIDSLYLLLKNMDVKKINEKEAYRLFYSYAVSFPLTNFSLLTYSNIKNNNLLTSLDNQKLFTSISNYYLYTSTLKEQENAASDFFKKMISASSFFDQNYLDANNLNSSKKKFNYFRNDILDANIKLRGTAFMFTDRKQIMECITNMMVFSNVIKTYRFMLLQQKKNGADVIKEIENELK